MPEGSFSALKHERTFFLKNISHGCHPGFLVIKMGRWSRMCVKHDFVPKLYFCFCFVSQFRSQRAATFTTLQKHGGLD